MKKPLTVAIPLDQLAALKHRCAWKGCRAICQPNASAELPTGWRWLLVHGGPATFDLRQTIAVGKLDRDAVLCPAHAMKLESLLEPIMLPTKETVQ